MTMAVAAVWFAWMTSSRSCSLSLSSSTTTSTTTSTGQAAEGQQERCEEGKIIISVHRAQLLLAASQRRWRRRRWHWRQRDL